MGSVFGRISEETPKFQVVSRHATFEVRRYAGGLAIESNDSANKGFMHLAKYIGVMGKPENDRGEKIAMTAPVVSRGAAMQFILPSSVGDSAPSPTNNAVSVRRRPAETMAVQAYSGSWDDADAERRAAALRAAAEAEGLATTDEWEWHRFNPPWTLPWMKKNEICVKIEA